MLKFISELTVALLLIGLVVLLIVTLMNDHKRDARFSQYCESNGMTYLQLADSQMVGKTKTYKRSYFCLTTDGKLIIIPDGVQAQS